MAKIIVCLVVMSFAAVPASAQTATNAFGVRGFATVGSITFQAEDSFDAIFESPTGVIFGGGGQVLLPWGIYVEVGASRFKRDGERAFVGPNREVFRLGIPVEVTITPIEVTGGWRYRHCPRTRKARACTPRVVPYGGAGLSSYRYKETSDFADPDENVDERFGGFHVLGGAEYLPFPWMAIGGEVVWSSIPDALGEGGVSAAFDEDNLGGTTFRLKISVGR
jgi:opacity protein-like surface antigen